MADPRMRPRDLAVIAAAIVAWAASAGCGESASRVRLVPLGGECARPLGAVAVRVTAYAATGERSKSIALDEVVAIDDFPADTEQLAVEVIGGGGATAAAGKSAPLEYGALADGATIPVFMAPPDGACATTPMREARRQPLIARAGRGVLVVGGTGASGPLATAELYDPDTEAWTAIDVPAVLASDPRGFAGAVLTTLPDGRVALTGGPLHAFAMFDPAKQAFDRDAALFESRVYHAAIATEEGDVIVAGGCSTLGDDGACAGVALHQTVRYRQGELGDPDRSGPPTNGRRVSPMLFDTGIGLDGARRYVLAGGTGDPGFADRFALADATVVKLDGGGVAAAALDGGAVLAALESTAVVYPPDGAAIAVAAPPATTGARLIALEDGSVAGFGGDPDGSVLRYAPTANQWTRELGNTGALTEPSLVRLDDGSVLVLGGDGSARAWRYRPSLVGPAAGSVTAVTMSGVGRGVLTAPDPRAVTRLPSGQWQLAAASDALTARALVGGPRTATGSVRMTGSVIAGGAALIAAQRGPGQAVIAELAPGVPARLVQLDGASRTELCAGSESLAFDPAAPIALRLAIADGMARATIDDREVLACAVTRAERGAWGVAALGAGAVLAVDSVTVAR